MDRFDYTVAGRQRKRNNSVGKFGGEENLHMLSSNSNHDIESLKNAKRDEPRKRAMDINKQPRQKWRSLFDELSMRQRSSAVEKNGTIDNDGNMGRKTDDLIARELERLHKLKLDIMRANDNRRKSYAGFGQERHQKSSVSNGKLSREPLVLTSDNKDTSEAPRRRRVTLTFPMDRRDTLKLPQIQPLNLKAEQSRRVREAKRNNGGVSVGERKGSEESVEPTEPKGKQAEHEEEAVNNSFFTRYGSPEPQVTKPLEEHHKASAGPQIKVSDYVDLSLKVKNFVKKPQPRPSEMSLRMERSTLKLLPSMDSAIKKSTRTNEEARHKVVNTETCPPISFYEDRSWYYQDKRGKCRYLRIPDSPVPPIHSVFEKD